jgi:hypothetical protein
MNGGVYYNTFLTEPCKSYHTSEISIIIRTEYNIN